MWPCDIRNGMSDGTSLSKTITNYRLPNSHTYHDNEDNKNCDGSSQIHTANKFARAYTSQNCLINSLSEHIPSRI